MLTSLFITRRHSVSEGARVGTSSSLRGPRSRGVGAAALDACGMRRSWGGTRGASDGQNARCGGPAHPPGVEGAWGARGSAHDDASFSVRGVQHKCPRVTLGRRRRRTGGQRVGLGTRGACHSGAQHVTQHPNISLESTPRPSHPAEPPWLCRARQNLPEVSGERPRSEHCPGFPRTLPRGMIRGCPHRVAMPGGCRASPHPTHAAPAWRWLRWGARQGPGDAGDAARGWPGHAEPGRKPLREGSSGLTNKSLSRL